MATSGNGKLLKTIGAIIGIVAALFAFAVGFIHQYIDPVQADNIRIEAKLDKHTEDHPSRDYLDLRFDTLEAKVDELKSEIKNKK